MIRFEIAMQWALLAGLVGPAVAEGQDPHGRPGRLPPEVRRDPSAPAALPGANIVLDEDVLAGLVNGRGYPNINADPATLKWHQAASAWASSCDPLEANFGLTLSPIDESSGASSPSLGPGVLVVGIKPGAWRSRPA